MDEQPRPPAECTSTTLAWLTSQVTRQQVITAFQVVKEQHVRVQAAYDAFGWWFLRNTDDARAVRAVRAELRERLRGLYWTVGE